MPASLGVIGGRGKAAIPGIRTVVSSYPMSLTFGAGKNDSEGSPAAPCLSLPFVGKFVFRWAVRTGSRSIQVNVKQAINISPRPSITVKANPAIGVNSDASASAGSSTGWITVGPVSISPTSDGVVLVELESNTTSENAAPCFFDHIVTT